MSEYQIELRAADMSYSYWSEKNSDMWPDVGAIVEYGTSDGIKILWRVVELSIDDEKEIVTCRMVREDD